VPQPGDRLGLGEESLAVLGPGEFAAGQHLEGDDPAQGGVPGLVDHPHAPAADDLQHLVIPDTRPGQRCGGVRSEGGPPSPGGGDLRLARDRLDREEGIVGHAVQSFEPPLAPRAGLDVAADRVEPVGGQVPQVEVGQFRGRGAVGRGHAVRVEVAAKGATP
jgi:hypothetical protein